MPATIALQAVSFRVTPEFESEEAFKKGELPKAVTVGFFDPLTRLEFTVFFDEKGWETFQRHVAENGNVPGIEIANPGALKDLPKMAIPKGA